MKSQRREFLRQSAAFRPRLERLESRDCPSCVVFQREQTLVILGDEGANVVAIAATREGGISVTCDVGDPQRFAGVNHIELTTRGGDDEITATFSAPGDPTAPSDPSAPGDPSFQFRADLGAGNDKLTISGFDPQPDPPLRSVSFDIHAGAGDDSIAATFACPSDPTSFHFRAALGDGNDKLTISGFDPQPDPPLASVEFDIRAGAGDDEVLFDLGGAEINGQFVVSAHGGLGNDRLSFRGIVPCIFPESELRIGLDGGAGDDLIDVAVTGLEIEGGLFVVDVSGGIGSDHLIVAIQPCILPAGEARIGVLGGAGDDLIEMSLSGLENEGGQFALEAAGGIGNDRLLVRALDPCIVPESETRIALLGNDGDDQIDVTLMNAEIEGLFNLAVLGGEGNDILDSFIIPCILPAGRANLRFDGDAGNDRIAARVEMDADSRGALAAAVFGGLGDDDLTLALFGVDDLSLLLALVDGGREFDVARVTRNVRVANCEEVIFLDEPR